MFSVIIPTYNHDQYIDQALTSVLSDSLVTEILVADDGSKDCSVQILEHAASQYPKIVRNLTTYPATNIGAHAMLNRLIAQASNEWIAVLNSDDRFVSGRFAAVRNLVKASKFDFCFGNLSIMDGSSTLIGRKRAYLDPQYPFPAGNSRDSDPENLLRMMLCQNYIATTSNMVFTKSLWSAVGEFRDYRYAHDWDFAIRCMLRGTARYIPEYMTYYRVHDSNTIKEARDLQDKEIVQIFSTLESDLKIHSIPGGAPYLAANEYL